MHRRRRSATPDDCIPLGSCVIRGLPPGLAKGSPVAVLLAYEPNGRLRVSVQVPSLDFPLEHEIIRHHGLSETELQDWQGSTSRRGCDPVRSDSRKPGTCVDRGGDCPSSSR